MAFDFASGGHGEGMPIASQGRLVTPVFLHGRKALQLGIRYRVQLKSHVQATRAGGQVLLRVSTQRQHLILLSKPLCLRPSPQDAASAK